LEGGSVSRTTQKTATTAGIKVHIHSSHHSKKKESVPKKLDEMQWPFCACGTSRPWEEQIKVWVAKEGEGKYRNHIEINHLLRGASF
jgi:hypothetical protein